MTRVAGILALLVSLQVLREGIEGALHRLIASTPFGNKMTTMCAMLLLTVLFILFAGIRKVSLSVFPKRFGKGYIIFTCVASLLLILSPSHFTDGFTAVALTIYGCIVTPVYEELIFRGYIWNRLDEVMSKPLYTYILSVVLFGLWHIGYVIPNIMSGNRVAVIGKLAAGIGYGAVLGFVRLKTHNCYSTILVHGLLNLFMI